MDTNMPGTNSAYSRNLPRENRPGRKSVLFFQEDVVEDPGQLTAGVDVAFPAERFGQIESSPILLQSHGYPIDFRNLKLQRLEPISDN